MNTRIVNSILATLSLAGLATTFPAAAQRNNNDAAFESDRRFCASGRSGMDFNTCMRQMQSQRSGWNNNDNRGNNNGRGNNDGWQNAPSPGWRAPPSSLPRLSDMQKRALDNCVLLQRSEQARCRATVLSTVR